MCKEDWCVGLRHKGGGLREGEWIYLKYLKRSWNREQDNKYASTCRSVFIILFCQEPLMELFCENS